MADELQRIRRDLDVIRQAAGSEPAFEPQEVYLNLGLVVTGLAAVLWAS